MQIKPEVTIGHLISIASSLVMVAALWGATSIRLANLERRADVMEASLEKQSDATAELTKSMAVLATVVADRDRNQTINVK